MNTVEKTISYLKAKGYKTTQVRSLVIDTLASSKAPLSVSEILSRFETANLRPNDQSSFPFGIRRIPNKTTIYRELDFLLEQGIITEVDFGESKKRYEFNTQQHHHHVICVRCKKIEEVDLSQDLSQYEDKISKEKNFKIIHHSLEFFGLCPKCQQL